jgi:Protein of unknown function (DUF4232)/Ricin-type beta-trefoil lectin domain
MNASDMHQEIPQPEHMSRPRGGTEVPGQKPGRAGHRHLQRPAVRGFGVLAVAFCSVALASACASPGPSARVAVATSPPPPAATAPASGSASPGPVATTQPAAPDAPPPGIPRCHTNEVAVTFAGVNSAMGHRGVALWLTNRSPRTCSVYGYEGLGFLDSQGKVLPTQLSRVAETHARVLLRPGGSAHATLVWQVPGQPPVTPTVMPDRKSPIVNPSQVEITPPDEYTHLTVPWPFGGVAGGDISTTPLSGAPIPAFPTNSYTIRTAFADMCIYVPGSANRTKVGVWKCNGTSSQRWTAYNDETLRINGKCLEVAGGSTKVGAKVDIGTCNGGPNQQWQIGQVSHNQFGPINAASGTALTDPGGSTTNGTRLVMGASRGDLSGLWRVLFYNYPG